MSDYITTCMTPDQIDALRFTAFRTNKREDQMAYYRSASDYFQNRHERSMNRAEAAEEALTAAYRAGVEDAARIADGYGGVACDVDMRDAIRALATPTPADPAERLKDKADAPQAE